MPSTPASSVVRPHGTIIIIDPAFAREIQRDTLTCCHCNKVWVVQHGSGKARGFCYRCNRVTCGGPGCLECVPIEKRIVFYERGQLRSLDDVDTAAATALPVTVRPGAVLLP